MLDVFRKRVPQQETKFQELFKMVFQLFLEQNNVGEFKYEKKKQFFPLILHEKILQLC